MAKIDVRRTRPTVINKFFGLNMDMSGDTQLKLGESPDMTNFCITANLKLTKRPGTKKVVSTASAIKGMWEGCVAGVYRFVYACAGHIYSLNLSTYASTDIGTVANVELLMFGYAGKLYVADGADYKAWDGSTFASVTGYRPLIAVSTPPTGGGTDLENLNQLTGAKRQKFSADGTATIYQLRETSVSSIDFVKLNGATLTLTTHYTVNLANGTVTPVTPANWPTGKPNNIEIGWTKGTGDRGSVYRMKLSVPYGASNDTRVFAWGDSSNTGTVRYTGLADGVPSAEYWPSLGTLQADISGSIITDCVQQQDKLNVYTDIDASYCSTDFITDALGRTVAIFPRTMLHGELGQIAPGQTRLLKNSPITLAPSGVYEWTASGVKDERSATYISLKVQPGLDLYDLALAKTADWDARGEMFITMPDGVTYVLNYRNGSWYRYDGILALSYAIAYNKLHYGASDGIYLMDESYRSDNGIVFDSHWESGYLDFGSENRPKYLDRGWISINPSFHSEVTLTVITDQGPGGDAFTAVYILATFVHADFNAWSFLLSSAPTPFRFKLSARKFAYAKIMLDSNSIADAAILSIDLADRMSGGEIR